MSQVDEGSQRESVAEFRPIHYLGNKSRFLDAIEDVVEELAAPGSAACDLFAGSAVVARRLALNRPVVCSDVQAYSSVLAKALTEPCTFTRREIRDLTDVARDWLHGVQPKFHELLDLEEQATLAAPANAEALADIIEYGSLEVRGRGSELLQSAKANTRGAWGSELPTLTRYYGGVYFSYMQALCLDSLRHAFQWRWGRDRDSTAVAALLGVASDLVSTVGNHFAQPVQPRARNGKLKANWIASLVRKRNLDVLEAFESWIARYNSLSPAPYGCRAVQADFRQTLASLESDIGVIYADPPYTRDHYSRFYHVLETIALDDDPGVTHPQGSTRPSRGLYRESRHQSPFSIRTQVNAAFRELFANTKRLDVPLVLSYSPMSDGTRARPHTRLIPIDCLVSMTSEYFTDVRLQSIDSSSHSRFNRAEVNARVKGSAEVLIIATN